MEWDNLGRLLIGTAVLLAIVGGIFLLVGRIPGLRSFGNLPGDIRIEGAQFACFAPIVSMCLLSIIATIVLNILIRIFDR